eukprot:scaffold246912_cov27-Tisochrysis_lutea.AAC.1
MKGSCCTRKNPNLPSRQPIEQRCEIGSQPQMRPSRHRASTSSHLGCPSSRGVPGVLLSTNRATLTVRHSQPRRQRTSCWGMGRRASQHLHPPESASEGRPVVPEMIASSRFNRIFRRHSLRVIGRLGKAFDNSLRH